MEMSNDGHFPIIFSVGLPTIWYDKESDNKWCLPREGEYMRRSLLYEFVPQKVTGWYKSALPYVQFFDCGYRVTSNNIDWNSWNNCCFIDIDTKKYKGINDVDLDDVEDKVYNELYLQYGGNFYCMQRSCSMTSFHFVFYYDCEKNELNFRKAQQLSMKKVLNAFVKTGNMYLLADENGDINKQVVDECCISPYQGMYLSANPIRFNKYRPTGEPLELEYEEIRTSEDIRREKLSKGIVDTMNDDFEFTSTDINFQWKDNNIRWEHHTRLQIAAFIYKLMNGDRDRTIETYCRYIVPYIKGKGISCLGSDHSENELRNLIRSQFNTLKYWQIGDFMLRFGCKIFGVSVKYTESHKEKVKEASKTYIPLEIREMDDATLLDKIKKEKEKIKYKPNKNYLYA